jgi:2-polyprenyl-6-methoxyphenol hydroxylase-like FAD-dependent oxidoreductase
MSEFRTEVLVVGAGPTGLFIAGELARHGVRPRIIEMASKPHNQTRATEIQPAVLQVLHRSGLADKFLESSIPMKGLRVLDRNMEEAFVSLIPPAESLYPNTRSMPQWRTEDGYVGFQTEKWTPEARNALDGFLDIQFSSAGI